MTATVKLEPMFLNPVDAALHASIELDRVQSGSNANLKRLQSILVALTDKSLRASGAIYGMTPLCSRATYPHIAAIDQALTQIDELFEKSERIVEKLSLEDASKLKNYCSEVHEHYQAAKWIEERTAFAS